MVNMIKYSLLSLAIIFSFSFIGLAIADDSESECPTIGKYTSELRNAMDATITENPSVANLPNIEDANGKKENAKTFLVLVATKLKSTGFNATAEVLNGNDNLSTGDIIALWKEGDMKMERYDAIQGDPQKTVGSASQTIFTGLIPLNCTADGGGKGCKCESNVQPIDDGSTFTERTIPGIPEGYMGLDQLLVFFLNWSKYILGIAVFVMIFFGGVKWFFSQGNPGEISKAQDIIKNAVIGAILLLSAYLILYTVNPDLINGSFTLPGIKTVPPTTTIDPGVITSCQNLQALASQNNEPYPRKNSAEVDTLIADIKSKLSGVNIGRMYTFDESYGYCNYTRGDKLCGKCSHAVNSCHYGGRSGKDGALAIDFAVRGSIGDRIIGAAMASGAKDARCENSSGAKVACSSSSATHVHVTSKSCDSN